MKTKKILLCTTPNTSLFNKKAYMEIGIGASYVAGGLDSFGYKVDYHDFNVALNSIRKKDDLLTDNDKLVLSDIKYLSHYLKRPNKKSTLYVWSNKLAKQVKGKEYNYIGLSLDRKTIRRDVSLFFLHFGIILASLFWKRFRVPIYIGGKHSFSLIKYNYINDLILELEKIPVTGFFLKAGAINFPKFLKRTEGNQTLSSLDLMKLGVVMTNKKRKGINKSSTPRSEGYFKKIKFNIEGCAETESDINIIPRFDIKNKKFLFFNPHKLFPSSLIKSYPKIDRIKPYYIIPFTFTLGCVNRCAFCRSGCSKHFYATPIKEVVDSIERLIEKHDNRYFRFYNNQINFSKKYVLDFCNELIKRKIKIKFSDSANLRHLSKEVLCALKEAGCIKLWYGAETISPKLLKRFKKDLTFEEIQQGLLDSANAGIWNAVNLIINFPHESEFDFKLNKKFITENKNLIDCFACHIFRLQPNTHMATHPAKYGIKIVKSLDNISGYAFDEIDGLSWQKKIALGKTRIAQIYGEPEYLESLFLSNDYLLFSFSQVIDKRDKLREIMKKYIEILKEEDYNKYRDFVFSINPYIHYQDSIFSINSYIY